uniref:N-acetyltransferase domain-containing protein n=1 Tax=Pseudomonas phage HRDY3 TaxID=3236930 RepID=A0AB39CEL4_9VIRU
MQLKMQRKSEDKRAYQILVNGCSATYLEIDDYPDFVAVEDVVTFGAHRRKGYMRQKLRDVRKREKREMRLLVYPDNEAAINLYKSVGFHFTKNARYRESLISRCVDPTDAQLLAKLPEMVWAAPQLGGNMKLKDLEEIFKGYTVHFDELGVDVYQPNGGKHVGSVLYTHGTGCEVVSVRRASAIEKRSAPFFRVAEICSFRGASELADQMDNERRLQGKRPCSPRTINNEFKAVKAVDFEEGVKMLVVWLGVLFGDHTGFAREHYKQLTTPAKTHYRFALRARESIVAPAEPDHDSTAPETPPVASLARTFAQRQAERETSSKRTVWGAEDDAIMALVMDEHKKLSDRVAQLHSARGSRISIPEFDRRRAAEGKSVYER